ncbi:DUF397 domain-containing protein [Streptomyces sp. TR02-1]|uniref:DUF397 domain-containing protein n=1 Tax=Streptomyces sp. TR02-1 TaxID=3385977 RepID=UPI0039A3BD18
MSSSSESVWVKSSYSGSSGDDCVEVAEGAGVVRVRDSKSTGGSEVAVEALAWASFVDFAAGTSARGAR